MSKITVSKEVETLEMTTPLNFGGFSHGEFKIEPSKNGRIFVPREMVNVAAEHGCGFVLPEDKGFVPEPEATKKPEEIGFIEAAPTPTPEATQPPEATPAPTPAATEPPAPTEAPSPSPEPTPAPTLEPEATPAPAA